MGQFQNIEGNAKNTQENSMMPGNLWCLSKYNPCASRHYNQNKKISCHRQ